LTDRILFMMSRIQNRILGHVKRELKKAGIVLSQGQMGVLLALERDGTVVMGKLSQILDMDNAALTRLVAGLEKRELVIREINLENRRQVRVTITPLGVEQVGIVKPVVMSTSKLISQGFSKEDMETYRKINQSILDQFSVG
jgi:DNA-binding MarR family transcriptional regulator